MSPSKPKRPATSNWKSPGQRSDLMKAIAAGAGVVVLTALVIFLIAPGSDDSTETPPAQTPITSVPSGLPDGSTDSTPTDSTPTDSTPTDSTPAGSTPTDSTPTDSTPAGSTPSP